MATGIIGTIANSSLTFTPTLAAKVTIAWSGSAGTLTVNAATVVSVAAAANGIISIHCAPGVAVTIASTNAAMIAVISALEELF